MVGDFRIDLKDTGLPKLENLLFVRWDKLGENEVEAKLENDKRLCMRSASSVEADEGSFLGQRTVRHLYFFSWEKGKDRHLQRRVR